MTIEDNLLLTIVLATVTSSTAAALINGWFAGKAKSRELEHSADLQRAQLEHGDITRRLQLERETYAEARDAHLPQLAAAIAFLYGEWMDWEHQEQESPLRDSPERSNEVASWADLLGRLLHVALRHPAAEIRVAVDGARNSIEWSTFNFDETKANKPSRQTYADWIGTLRAATERMHELARLPE